MYLPSTERDSIEKEGQLFYKRNESGYKEVLPGIRMKTLVYGEKTLLGIALPGISVQFIA
jgi:hypothetical protein